MLHFGINRSTGDGQLAHGGLITRGRGRGTFVALQRLGHDVSLAFEAKCAWRESPCGSNC
jgi:GntR family transcriptional regulator